MIQIFMADGRHAWQKKEGGYDDMAGYEYV